MNEENEAAVGTGEETQRALNETGAAEESGTEAEERAAELERRERELDERVKELDRRELRVLARETLAEKGMAPELCELLNYQDREKCLASVAALEKALAGEVARQVDKRLAGQGMPLPGTAAADEDGMSDEEYYRRRLK